MVSINALPARTYGSQGQQRSAALALKLAEAALLEEATGEKPVALLDDVMSELDAARQDYILNRIRDWQVFITCCESGTVLRLDRGNRNSRAWRIRSGALNEEEKGGKRRCICIWVRKWWFALRRSWGFSIWKIPPYPPTPAVFRGGGKKRAGGQRFSRAALFLCHRPGREGERNRLYFPAVHRHVTAPQRRLERRPLPG